MTYTYYYSTGRGLPQKFAWLCCLPHRIARCQQAHKCASRVAQKCYMAVHKCACHMQRVNITTSFSLEPRPQVGGGTGFETRQHCAWTQLTEEIGVQILLSLWNMVKVYTLLLLSKMRLVSFCGCGLGTRLTHHCLQ